MLRILHQISKYWMMYIQNSPHKCYEGLEYVLSFTECMQLSCCLLSTVLYLCDHSFVLYSIHIKECVWDPGIGSHRYRTVPIRQHESCMYQWNSTQILTLHNIFEGCSVCTSSNTRKFYENSFVPYSIHIKKCVYHSSLIWYPLAIGGNVAF